MGRRKTYSFVSTNINEIVEIYFSNMPDCEKAYRIYYYGLDPLELRVRLNGYCKRGETEYSIDLLNEICDYYLETYEDGSLAMGKFMHDNECEITCLRYCEHILKLYIDEKESWKKELFFQKHGIDSSVFGFCKHTVAKLNSDLFQIFQRKEKMDKIKEKTYTILTLNDIANAILKGKFKDGTDFTDIEFWKRMPFIGDFSSFERLQTFMKMHLKEKQDIILEYINDMQINRDSFLPIDSTYTSRLSNKSIGLDSLKPEDMASIKKYLRDNDIPLVNGAYTAVKRMMFSDSEKGKIYFKK